MRFIIHSILILVATQLCNVAMGLLMSESQHNSVLLQLTELHENLTHGEDYDFTGPFSASLIRPQPVSMTRSELPCRVRVMLDGIITDKDESSNLNPETDRVGKHEVFVSQPDRYFHQLCILII